jgi:hypothetical protein
LNMPHFIILLQIGDLPEIEQSILSEEYTIFQLAIQRWRSQVY